MSPPWYRSLFQIIIMVSSSKDAVKRDEDLIVLLLNMRGRGGITVSGSHSG